MATRTVSVAGGNYNVAATWVELAVPTSSDDVVFTSSSGNLTVNVNSSCKSFDATNYTGTLAMNSALNIYGNITLVSGMTITGSSKLIFLANATLTSNGKTWPCSIEFLLTSGVFTFTDTWNVSGTVTQSSSSYVTFNGSTLNCASSLILVSSPLIGTTSIKLVGTGTWSGYISNPFEINTTGTITLGSNIGYGYNSNVNTFLYTAGTIINTGSTFVVKGNCNLNTSGMTFNKIQIDASATLLSDLNCSGLFETTSYTTITGAYNINAGAGITILRDLSGTCTLVSTGTGTWTSTGGSIGQIIVDFIINNSGTLTVSGDVYFKTKTFTYATGTVVTTGSNLILNAGATLNSNGISWNNTTITTGIVTLTSLLTVNGTLDVGSTGTVTFAGTSGFTCHTFLCTTAGRIINFATGKTYTVTNSLIITGAVGSRVSFVSTSNGALFNLQAGATQSVTNCNATWINSSGGKTIYSNPSTLTNTINWSKSNGFITWFNSQF